MWLGCEPSAHATYFEDAPLAMRSPAPAKSLRLSPVPAATSYDSGWSLSVLVQGASIYALNETYELDYYRMDYGLLLEFSPNERWQLSLGHTLGRSDDAHLDQLSLTFHDLFGIGQNGRDQVPKHRFMSRFPEYGLAQDDFSSRTLSRQTELGVGFRWWQRERHQMSSRVTVQYHQGPTLWRGGGRWDQALQWDYGYHTQRHRFNAMAALSHSGAQRVLAAPVRPYQWHLALGYRFQWHPRHSMELQYLVSQGGLKRAAELSKSTHEIALAYRFRYQRLCWQLGVLQNSVHADNSADVAFQTALRYLF
ncbi:DUF3187 family protein [Ferrimonas gelatinilytica]|uniref:DUF3187 family protein n=2 Tax=Ferrimonas gelatinilytica TaxID=1255257 RepID=A0ABP9RV83_9GAMM